MSTRIYFTNYNFNTIFIMILTIAVIIIACWAYENIGRRNKSIKWNTVSYLFFIIIMIISSCQQIVKHLINIVYYKLT